MLIGAVAVILGVIVIAVLIFRGKGDSDKDDRGSNRDEQKEENTVDLEELEDDLRGEWVCQGNAEAFTRAYAEKFADDAYTASLDWAEEMVKAEEDSQYLYEEFLDEMGSREDFMEKMFDDVDESELEAMEAIRFQNGRFGMCADGEWLETENDDVVALELSYRIVDEETLEIQTSFEMMDEDYPLTIDSSFEVGFRLDGDELILEVDREEVQFERD